MAYKDPERAREYAKRWYLANRERVRERKRDSERRWCAANREKKNAYWRRWRAANREHRNDTQRRSRARKIDDATWAKIKNATTKLKSARK